MKIIAESAFNHNGDINELKKIALAAKNAGTDFFTCQIMNTDAFCVNDYSKYDIYKKTEISNKNWIDFFKFCKKNDINVIPCVLDEKSFDLVLTFDFKLIKLHATDITNGPFLNYISKHDGFKIILETQCASIFEIEYAVNILDDNKIDSIISGFSNYPTEIEDLNLNSIDHIKKRFNLPTGFADHSLDVVNVPLLVLAKGCKYLEKHITITRNNRNYDYQVSLYPNEFATMVNSIKHYSMALGSSIKHPNKSERPFRDIMYKKVVKGERTLKRSDNGQIYIDNIIDSFSKTKAVVSLIARLKSKRLKNKVLKKISNQEMIIDLYERLSISEKFKTILCTSYLEEDKKLVELFKAKNYNTFLGDPNSVIDRMLSLGFKEKSAFIFRVTGDNPFTDPELMEEMLEMIKENNLDYVKVNNAPFGLGAELFSMKYLWKLYLKLETTEFSEYLSWYVLNDKDVKMGSIDLDFPLKNKTYNLSVDYEEDFFSCLQLYKKMRVNSFKNITLKNILLNLNVLNEIDLSKEIKLPMGDLISLHNFLNDFKNSNYKIRKTIIIK